MRRFILIIVLVAALLVGFTFLNRQDSDNPPPVPGPPPVAPNPSSAPVVIAKELEIPWDIAFLPDGGMLVAERPGRITLLTANGEKMLIHDERVSHRGEGGLLGMTLHPNFETNHFIYIYFTAPGNDSETENRVERHRFVDNKLTEKKIIIDGIPGALYHDGGRIGFGPDGLLYITTGDATKPDRAQDKASLSGKILRLRDDGTIPSDNPFHTAVYSYGHRNPQGLAWDDKGNLWSTEHGRSGVLSGLDEINLVRRGANYGWPIIEGSETLAGMQSPARHSGTTVTWAPASLIYHNGSLFFAGLRGEALYEAVLDGDQVADFKTYFHEDFGRLRTVRLGPDDMLYITTSNRDGRGTVREGDDRIMRVDPAKLAEFGEK